jgi:hypothetical protein
VIVTLGECLPEVQAEVCQLTFMVISGLKQNFFCVTFAPTAIILTQLFDLGQSELGLVLSDKMQLFCGYGQQALSTA